MKEFRTGSSRVLITTDLLSRGIDVQSVSLVINFELPRKKESYIHRIGRSGRFGRKGTAINFVLPTDIQMIKDIQTHYSTQIDLMPVDLAEVWSAYPPASDSGVLVLWGSTPYIRTKKLKTKNKHKFFLCNLTLRNPPLNSHRISPPLFKILRKEFPQILTLLSLNSLRILLPPLLE